MIRPIALTSGEYFDIASELPSEHAEYSKGWLYITQAIRDYRLHVVAKDFYAGLGKHGPNLVVVRPSGEVPEGFVETLASLVADEHLDPHVFVKKARGEMLSQLAAAASNSKAPFVAASVECGWDRDAPHDDDTFPEIVLNVPETLHIVDQQGHRARKYRWTLRSFGRSTDGLDLADVRTVGRPRMESMLASHFAPHISYADSYREMLRILENGDPRACWEHFVPMIHDEPVGLFAYEKLDLDAAGIYSSVALSEYRGLAEVMLRELLMRMSISGIEYANFGGSETEGLARYKEKFRGSHTEHRSFPIHMLDLTSLI